MAGPPTTTPVVELSHVQRGFGRVRALEDLSLQAFAGTVTVLVGPNGAGKTTALRMVTGALDPTWGSVRTFGLDPRLDGEEVRRRCGVVAAKPALYDRLTGADNLLYAARLYGVRRGADLVEAAERFGIAHALGQRVGGYSTGMKTRLALARAVMHHPDLLLLDEPTSGLDPESSVAVLRLIREFAAEGVAVLVCTHLLLEAEGLADSVVVLVDGVDRASGHPSDLIRTFWKGRAVAIDAEDRRVLDLLATAPGVVRYLPPGPGPATVEINEHGRVADLVTLLVRAGGRVTRVEPHAPTLEELYFAVRSSLGSGGPPEVPGGPLAAAPPAPPAPVAAPPLPAPPGPGTPPGRAGSTPR